MSEKTYVFDNNDGTRDLLASVLPALSQRGVDTSALLAMCNGNGGLFGRNGLADIIGLIAVASIFGYGNNGLWGGNANNSEKELLMSAIQRNGVDISQLAGALNCSTGRIYDAIGNVSTQICNLAGQNGLSFQQIVNAIQSGNSNLANQVASCCCDLRNAINSVNMGLERGFSTIAYETQRQTCDLRNEIGNSTQQILAGQAAIEKRELQREIETLREEKQTYKLGTMMAQNNAPLAAAISNLQNDVDGIKCKLPKTETIIANPEYIPVNRGINIGYAPTGYCGYGNFTNFYNAGWSNGSLWG